MRGWKQALFVSAIAAVLYAALLILFVLATAFVPGNNRNCDCRQQRTAEGKLESRQRSCLDEETASAPEDRRAEHEQQRRYTRFSVHYTWPGRGMIGH